MDGIVYSSVCFIKEVVYAEVIECMCQASTPSGSGVPTIVDSAMSSAPSRRVAECVYAKIDELRMIVEGKGAEEDVELLTEVGRII